MTEEQAITLHCPVEAARATWGKDHWSTLIYAETRAVDHKGIILKEHMRCDSDLHPEFAHRGTKSAPQYPTVLAGGQQLADHDDWSCLNDFQREGLVELFQTVSGESVRVRLTPSGFALAHAVRIHKANGGSTANFTEN